MLVPECCYNDGVCGLTGWRVLPVVHFGFGGGFDAVYTVGAFPGVLTRVAEPRVVHVTFPALDLLVHWLLPKFPLLR